MRTLSPGVRTEKNYFSADIPGNFGINRDKNISPEKRDQSLLTIRLRTEVGITRRHFVSSRFEQIFFSIFPQPLAKGFLLRHFSPNFSHQGTKSRRKKKLKTLCLRVFVAYFCRCYSFPLLQLRQPCLGGQSNRLHQRTDWWRIHILHPGKVI